MMDCQINQISFDGWSAWHLANSLISVVAVPQLGGRILGYSLGPYQFLFRNRELAGTSFTPDQHYGDGSLLSWKNYGGEKTWPAPQGWDSADQWAGPPDPVLDSGTYQATPFHDGEMVGLTMTSPADRRTGLRIHRHARVRSDTSKLYLDLQFENVVDHAVRWAIWDVAQLDCSQVLTDGHYIPNQQCWLYTPVEQAAGDERLYQVMFGDDNSHMYTEIAPGLLGIQYQGMIAKIGVTNSAGWLAFANHATGYVCCARFPFDENAEYPDNGASVECWTEAPGAAAPPTLTYRSAGYLLEAEVLGPMTTLQPGQHTSLSVEWATARCPGPILYVGEVGCTHEKLSLDYHQGWARVRGSFGCFEAGQVELAWLGQAGQVLKRSDMQAASPLAVLALDSVLSVPEGTMGARLEIHRYDGTYIGTLDEASIQ